MSVCRSEPLFSSMRDSEMQSELNNPSVSDGHPKGAAGVAHGVHAIPPGPQDLSLIQDSLTDEDFHFSEKVTVNKNNYTLTFSGQGVIGSFIASMVSSTGAILEPQGKPAAKVFVIFFKILITPTPLLMPILVLGKNR